MKNFGVVIAMASELENVMKTLGAVEKVEKVGIYEVFHVKHGNIQLYITISGVGEIAAAATTQMMITHYNVDAILNFGFVGALDDDLKCQQIVVVKDVVHYDFDTSALDNVKVGRYAEFDDIFVKCDNILVQKALQNFENLKAVRIASGDKFIADSKKKQWLINTFGAEICDMESAGIIITAKRNNLPVLSLKVISDNANEDSLVSFNKIVHDGSLKCADILAGVLNNLGK